MIISASRRTDIPNYYYEWFTNRLRERFVLVRNPMNYNQVSRIDLSPDVVDCIVFWTKNPRAMLDKLYLIDDYNYYFQFTLNSYGEDVEPHVPSKGKEVIESFKRLSDKIGSEKVIWRYDPVLLTDKYNVEYHIKYFDKLVKELAGYTEKCVFSFIDIYPKIKNNITKLGAYAPLDFEKIEMAKSFKNIANQHGILLETCAESTDLCNIGINHGKCIDDKLIEKILGYPINLKKDKNQRAECGCVESIDIGAYDTCRNGCKYCYANHSRIKLENNMKNYNINSPILCGKITEDDIIKERKVSSSKSMITGEQQQFLLDY